LILQSIHAHCCVKRMLTMKGRCGIMEHKWVCSKCGSVNRTADGAEMVCFICGAPGTVKPAPTPAPVRKPPVREKKTERPAEAEDTGSGLMDIIRRMKKRLFEMRVSEGAADEGAADWTVRRSPPSSREAYVEAVPAKTETAKAPERGSVPTHTRRDETRREFSASAPVSVEAETWPEHRIRLCMDKLCASGCIQVEKQEINGTRGYRLKYEGGNERFLNVNNMKMMGYAQDL